MVKHQLGDGEVAMKSPRPSITGVEVSHDMRSRRGIVPCCPWLVWKSPILSTTCADVSQTVHHKHGSLQQFVKQAWSIPCWPRQAWKSPYLSSLQIP